MNRVAGHPNLKDSTELKMFLSAGEGEWVLEITKWNAETYAQNRPMTGAVQWFKSLQHSAATLVSGKAEEIQEDAEYVNIRDFINR